MYLQDFPMLEIEKAVLRFNDGTILKGHISKFSSDSDMVTLLEAETAKEHTVDIHQLKAIFFVKSFCGDSGYREKKSYGMARPKGRKIFIKFKDGEGIVGFLEGHFPWGKGFFLSKQEAVLKGFFILPVDGDSNNLKVFVVSSSVIDVTVIP
jgi:hypothetical protein